MAEVDKVVEKPRDKVDNDRPARMDSYIDSYFF